MKEQIERIHEKYEDTWACMMDYLPDCSTCIEYWRGRLDQVYYRTITTLCEAECQARVERLIESIKNMESPFAFSLDGKPIPKWEKQFDGFEEAREMISQAIKKEYLKEGVDVS